MDSYIVRIYRRNPRDPEHVAGIVETVSRGSSASFTDKQGLWDILVSVAKVRRRNVRSKMPKT